MPHIRLSEAMDYLRDAFWDPMPDGRKALLLSGLSALIVARVILRRKKTVQLAGG
jgi:hypothetical protein